MNNCPICLEPISNNGPIVGRWSGCRHGVHIDCLESREALRGPCYICRSTVAPFVAQPPSTESVHDAIEAQQMLGLLVAPLIPLCCRRLVAITIGGETTFEEWDCLTRPQLILALFGKLDFPCCVFFLEI